MCGIFGAYGPSAASLKSDTLADVLQRLQHRGPDAEGVYLSPSGMALLGHVRLSILDLSAAANQPMLRGDQVLVYNGELYNHQTLRQQAPAVSARCTTHSDTETLLFLLAEEGVSALQKLTGMFAGAWYDAARDRLVLFRDPLGIKPLYWMQAADSTVYFSSEIKAFRAMLPRWQARVSAQTLESYLLFENYPQEMSMFEGVHLLPPGGVLTLAMHPEGVVQLRQEIQNISHQTSLLNAPFDAAFNPSPEALPEGPPADPDWVPELTRRIQASVHSHLMSDVPLGVYLSGGIDSSLVATLAAREQPDLLGFTGYFDQPGGALDAHYDERPLARDVARAAGIELHEVPITPEDFIDTLDAVVYALDEPRMGMGAFSQYVVAREAAKHRKVILAGHGGDELFGGYPLFKAFWILQAGFSPAGLSALLSLRAKEWPWLLNVLWQEAQTGFLSFAPTLSPLKNASFSPEQHPAFCTDEPSQALEGLARYYREVYLPGLLVVEDKISMAHSLETRVPLWSQPLLQWVSQIPLQQKLRGGELKALLKEVAQPFLPPALLRAPKRGFPTPLRLWFRGPLYEFISSRLDCEDSPLAPLLTRAELRQLLNSHRSQPLPFALDERRAHRIWILLCLESWLRQFQVTWDVFPARHMPLSKPVSMVQVSHG